jgi:CMP-N,N'-diacetyllegionaminic acid synthase
MKTLGIIPARGGSKGIPRKNIRPLAGKPMIVWTIAAAVGSGCCDRLVVSTDDPEIVAVANAWGGDIPLLRPKELATDETPTIDVVRHALDTLGDFDTVLLLQPTSPLRSSDDIVQAMGIFKSCCPASCVGVTEVYDSPYWSYFMEDRRLRPIMGGAPLTRRQDLPQVVTINGAIYIADAGRIRDGEPLVGADAVPYVMPRERSIDIDTELDFQFCEYLLSPPTQ